VLYNGDNYTQGMGKGSRQKEAFPMTRPRPVALKALVTQKALDLFDKYQVLSNVELKSRYFDPPGAIYQRSGDRGQVFETISA